jgi:hypothetical protein
VGWGGWGFGGHTTLQRLYESSADQAKVSCKSGEKGKESGLNGWTTEKLGGGRAGTEQAAWPGTE